MIRTHIHVWYRGIEYIIYINNKWAVVRTARGRKTKRSILTDTAQMWADGDFDMPLHTFISKVTRNECILVRDVLNDQKYLT